MSLTDRDAILVFAKPPEPGRVKTRLQPVLSPEQAAGLYRAFLQDTVAAAGRLPVDLRVYVAGDTEMFPTDLLPAKATVHRQQGVGLGARMSRAFSETFSAGYERAIIIGTDCPMLSASVLEQAFTALDRNSGTNVPIGLSDDGGYYLLGLSAPCAAIFEMTYSHSDVAAETLQAIVRTGRLPVLLPAAYDVDRPGDLRRLAGDLTSNPERAPHSRRALQVIDAVEFVRPK